LSDPVRLIASYATGFRTPSSTDRFGFGGNPDLEPETSQSLELSGRYSTAMHRGRISLFQNNIDDLINFVDPDGFDGLVPGRNENIDRTRTRGVELAYTLDKAPFIIDANLTLQDPKDLDTDRQLARRAKQKFGLKAAYMHRQTTYSAEYTHVGERPDSAYSDITLDGYDLVNLSATTRLAERLRVGIRLENITDEDYQLADGFNSAGRSAFVNLRYINNQ
jgi:vitamin B12 transporter